MIIRYVIGASAFCKSGHSEKMSEYWKKLRHCGCLAVNFKMGGKKLVKSGPLSHISNDLCLCN